MKKEPKEIILSGQKVTKGSIKEVAETLDIPEELLLADAKVVIMLDLSYSMNGRNPGDDKLWYQQAIDQAKFLTNEHSGQVILIPFSTEAELVIDGQINLSKFLHGTRYLSAFKEAKIFDGEGMKFFFISDGAPDPDENRSEIKKWVRELQAEFIPIYIGPEGGYNSKSFLESLTDNPLLTGLPKQIGELVRKMLN